MNGPTPSVAPLIDPSLSPPKDNDERKAQLIGRKIQPQQCKALRAPKAVNKEWARANLYTPPGDIDVTLCPSFEAWNLLISYAGNPEKAFADYDKVGTTKDELEAERRRLMASAEIKMHLQRARNAFNERIKSGLPLN